MPRCLSALQDFDEIIVIDSGSKDETCAIARSFGARVEDFSWNGEYPKKRQWCLDNLDIKHDFVFFVDGDEEVTPELVVEIKSLDKLSAAGYFVKGQYVWVGRGAQQGRDAQGAQALHYGLKNNKLALFNHHKVEFPVIDDLDIDGMGEIEGHYQPVLKTVYKDKPIEQLNASLRHFAYEDQTAWQARHERYAHWESQMIIRCAYPKEPNRYREALKNIFRNMPSRSFIAFFHCYILKAGFLDGLAGWGFAASRFYYYRMVSHALKTSKALEKSSEDDKSRSAL